MKQNKSIQIIIIWIQTCLLIGLIIFRLLYESFESQAELLIYPFCCLLIGLAIWSFWSWYILTKSLFNPYLLFVLSAFLFNGGQMILEVFHLNENGILGDWALLVGRFSELSAPNILNAIFLVNLGMISLHLGALISLGTVKEYQPPYNKQYFILRSNYSYLIGSRLLWISILPTIFTFKRTISIVLTSGYSSLFEAENFFSATGVNAILDILATFLVPASIFMVAGSRDKKKVRFIATTIIFIYAIIKFCLGQRNQATMALIAFAWIWNQLIHPLPTILLIGIGSLMTFVIFPVVAISRNSGGENFSTNFLLETLSSIDNPAIATISEMGGSLLTVFYTIQLVPSEKNFQMGADYLYALLTIIPNVWGKLHPTIDRGLPSDWLVKQIDPHFADVGGGYGFSFIAEAYLNFGWVGSPIAIAVIGFLFAKFTLWAMKSHDPVKMATVASFLSFFLFYARAESAVILRALIWYSFLPYLGVCLLNNSRSNKTCTIKIK
ncbi:MAG: O-antigen polysaccharide polymerase Wzy [Nostocales cyanobacterium ELA583]|jgi:oligosaccharide repeat unit polymerase